MRVLLIGSGGREHALAAALVRSPSVEHVFCANGNPGIGEIAELKCINEVDAGQVLELAREVHADLVVIGPEAPLVAGVADRLRDAGFAVFGPGAAAAQIEGSKAFAKDVMASAGVDTARYIACDDIETALDALHEFDEQVVVKADGIAAGKGVLLCHSHDEARDALSLIMEDEAFGEAGARVVVEEMMTGPEASLFFLSDGKTVKPLPSAQDFKRVFDGDQGLNTGGMGAYSPVPAVDDAMANELATTIAQPVIDELARRGMPFIGLLYAGLMLTPTGVRVVEFNCRFGDPETQAILPRLRSDLGEVLLACAQGRLDEIGDLDIDPRDAVTVVLASGGYPGDYRTGLPITGLNQVHNVAVFHAGTATKDGQLVTKGGRVLAVTALGSSIRDARETVYDAVDTIQFDGKHARRDIAEYPTV
ncbi:phosphoribosylamine--glycine ligase [Stomatohabitans albus]|uniref:phosphoribosylamine--glycine ligase n=1 Tax=Stomatohabitans albus TaxID=3110766 RepID=UPI00300D4C3F